MSMILQKCDDTFLVKRSETAGDQPLLMTVVEVNGEACIDGLNSLFKSISKHLTWIDRQKKKGETKKPKKAEERQDLENNLLWCSLRKNPMRPR